MKTIITAVVLALSVSAHADMNADQMAKEVAAEVSKDLPQQLAGDMTLTAVAALGSRLIAKAQMDYDRAHTNQVMEKTGWTYEQMMVAHATQTKSDICSSGNTKALIDLGGEVIYKYFYSDGILMTEVSVKSCE